jgi:hypothetical protein
MSAISIATGIVIAWVAITLIVFYSGALRQGHRDSTDRADKRRSGLMVLVDYGTGVHYVLGPMGGIAPRFKADGTVYTQKDETAR